MGDGEKLPTAPRGLGVRGRKLWRDVVTEHELRPDELALLGAAARTADELDRLETELTTAEVVVAGSTGQERPNPLFREVREHRKTLAGLLRQLRLIESDDDGVVPLHVTAMKRRAANVRWSRERGER